MVSGASSWMKWFARGSPSTTLSGKVSCHRLNVDADANAKSRIPQRNKAGSFVPPEVVDELADRGGLFVAGVREIIRLL
jgi:hypothetical protein